MFQNWGFLLSEIWVLLALAALIGVLAGWIIWGSSAPEGAPAEEADPARLKRAEATVHRLRGERDEARKRVDRCRSDGEKKDARLKEMELELDELRGKAAFTAPLPAFEAEDDRLRGYDESSGAPAGPPEGIAVQSAGTPRPPAALDAPGEGGADDLTRIKGIGPKLEAMLNAMGFFHFEQIAGWSPEEEAWVDSNLKRFKGRAGRDGWVAQAKALSGPEADGQRG